MQIFSQRDPRWAGHALGSGAGELGPYGCYETCFTMVAYDAFADMHYTPDVMDNALYGAGVFSGDNLPDNALDRAWPDRFRTHTENGFDVAAVNAAIASPDTYAIVCIHNPAAGVTGYHFMVMYGAGPNFLVADPWWGKVMTLATWGGPGVAVKVVFVQKLDPGVAAAAAKAIADAKAAAAAQAAAAAAAQAAADVAAAKAKADADAAAAQAAAAAKAVADAQAAADAKAAQDAAQAAAAKAASDALAAAAAAAAAAQSVPVRKAAPILNAPKRSLIDVLVILIRALITQLGGK